MERLSTRVETSVCEASMAAASACTVTVSVMSPTFITVATDAVAPTFTSMPWRSTVAKPGFETRTR